MPRLISASHHLLASPQAALREALNSPGLSCYAIELEHSIISPRKKNRTITLPLSRLFLPPPLSLPRRGHVQHIVVSFPAGRRALGTTSGATYGCSLRKIVVLYLKVIKVATITTQTTKGVLLHHSWAATVAGKRKLASHPRREQRPGAEAPEIASLGDQRL